MQKKVKKKQILYYARIMPSVGVFEICELKVRCVTDEWFSAIEKTTKQAFLFFNTAIDNFVFEDRVDALNLVINKEMEYKKRTFEKDNDIYE